MTIIAILAGLFEFLVVLGLFLAFILPCQPGTEDEFRGGIVNYKALWCLGIGFFGSLIFVPIFLYLQPSEHENNYKSIEVQVPEPLQIETIIRDGSLEIHRETF